jgi:hypothetical protein
LELSEWVEFRPGVFAREGEVYTDGEGFTWGFDGEKWQPLWSVSPLMPPELECHPVHNNGRKEFRAGSFVD